MSLTLCTQHHRILAQYLNILENLRDIEADLEDYDPVETRRELVRSEARLYQLHRELYENLTYQRNHAQMVRTPGDFDPEDEVPEKQTLYLAPSFRLDAAGEKEYLNIHGEVIDGYLAIEGDVRRGAAFGQVSEHSFHLLDAEGVRISGEEFPAPKGGFVRGVCVVEPSYSIDARLINTQGAYLTPEGKYGMMRLEDSGFVEARLRGKPGYHILNPQGEVVLEVKSVVSIEWGVALVEEDDNFHYVDLETGQAL